MTQEMELVKIDAQNAVELFTAGGLDSLLASIETKVRAISLDPSTVAGRALIKTTAYQVIRTKTALDAEGKKLTEGWRKATATVNAERKKSEDRLDALAEEIRAPLTAFENKEKVRIASHEAAILELEGLATMVAKYPDMSARDLSLHLSDYELLHAGRDWEEFAVREAGIRANTITAIQSKIAAREKHEADQAELARLRKEAEDRAQAEREAAIAAKPAEDARLAAKRKAKADADAEANRVIEAAEAEARRVAAEAERVRAKNELAAKREREKIESERKAEDQKRLKREADEKLRAKVRSDLIADLRSVAPPDPNRSDRSEDIADALMAGKIRHITVTI